MKLKKDRVNRNYFENKRVKAAENTIRLENAFLTCEKSVSPLWLAKHSRELDFRIMNFHTKFSVYI